MRHTKMRLHLTHQKSFPVKRVKEGSRDPETGRWEEGGVDSSFTSTMGNEQPLPGYEKQMLPESFRSRDVRKFFSLDFLNSIEEADQQTPDEVTIDGYQFEVTNRRSYHMGVRDHYEYVLTRVEQSAGGVK